MIESLAAPIAAVFPGQGSQNTAMLPLMAGRSGWSRLSALAAEIGGPTVAEIVQCGKATDEQLRRNEISSLLTVLSSLLWLDEIKHVGCGFSFAAGYSVGQWSAMCAAGMCSERMTLEVVWKRALIMNSSPAIGGKMLAVIGCPAGDVETVCASIRESTGYATVSNYNAPCQMTIAGVPAAIEQAQKILEPKCQKLVTVPTAGAWHCALLDPVVADFRNYLDKLSFDVPRITVIDNLTGIPIPSDPDALRDHLALHLARPVIWDTGLRTLVNLGARSCLEVGYGDMLTRFGFFVDRNIMHKAIEPIARR